MSFVETALQFGCQGEKLLGILSSPTGSTPPTGDGVIIVVGGPQYRAGAHRQFVSLARSLASQGTTVMRFDVRGMGDSSGPLWNFESLTDDIGAAMDALLERAPQLKRVVLAGLCDGASASLIYLHKTQDERVKALCLLNPWLRSEQSLARTHVKHYYWQRFASADFWRKLLRGGVGLRALKELFAAARSALAVSSDKSDRGGDQIQQDFRAKMLKAWQGFGGDVFLGISTLDLTAQEFLGEAAASSEWRALLTRSRTCRRDFEGADHTLSQISTQTSFEAEVARWLQSTSTVHRSAKGTLRGQAA